MAEFVRIPYDNDAFVLRAEYDETDALDDVLVDITTTPGGTALVDGASATLFTDNSTAAATSIGGESFVFTDAPSATPVHGDRFWVADSVSGAGEFVVCDYYTAATKTVSLTRPLRDAHAITTTVRGLWALYELDTSTVTTWTKGLRVRIRWTPQTAATEILTSISQEGRVLASALELADLRVDFEAIYPSVYTIIEDRWQGVEDAATRRFRSMLRARGRDIDTIADQSVFEPLLIDLVYLMGAPVEDKWKFEITTVQARFDKQFELFADSNIWFDDDSDGVLDPGEDTPIIDDDVPLGRGL